MLMTTKYGKNVETVLWEDGERCEEAKLLRYRVPYARETDATEVDAV